MEAKDWLKGVEKKLMITQCTDQLYGMAANWWETY
jgi:hypothetical protein